MLVKWREEFYTWNDRWLGMKTGKLKKKRVFRLLNVGWGKKDIAERWQTSNEMSKYHNVGKQLIKLDPQNLHSHNVFWARVLCVDTVVCIVGHYGFFWVFKLHYFMTSSDIWCLLLANKSSLGHLIFLVSRTRFLKDQESGSDFRECVKSISSIMSSVWSVQFSCPIMALSSVSVVKR